MKRLHSTKLQLIQQVWEKFFSIVLLLFVMIAFTGKLSFAADNKTTKSGTNSVSVLTFNKAFFLELSSKDAMKRDNFLFSKLNSITDGIIPVSKVEEKLQFKKKYRIVGTSSGQYVSIIFHIYTENGEYMDLLPQGQKFEFKGQLVMITPVSSKRDSYIIDIILEDGAAVVD